MTDVIVLGAGIVGVSTAFYLQKKGVNVLLVDKGQPKNAASFGNAGVIQAEAMEPYAFPRNAATIVRMLTGADNHLYYTIAGIAPILGPLISYWKQSETANHRNIATIHSQLISAALKDHQELIQASDAHHLIRKDGYLLVSRATEKLELEHKQAARWRETYGVESETHDTDSLKLLEPGLRLPQGGGIHWIRPWTVSDPAALTQAYRNAFLSLGGSYCNGDAISLCHEANSGWSIKTENGACSAQKVVMALGSATPSHASRFRHHFPLIPKRGYHQHFDATDILQRPVLDLDFGYVMAPMRSGLRLTTGVAFGDAQSGVPAQLKRARQAASDLTGISLEPVSDVWTGVRPCMPDMLPVVGQSNHFKGLWFNFGHGHQGLTLGPTTGKILADQILGKNELSDVEAALSCNRF